MFMNTILSMFQSVKQYTVSGNLINWESGGKVWHFVTEQSKWIWMSYQPAWTACVLTVILQSWTLSHVNISRSAGSHSTELRTARIRKLVFYFPAVLRWRKVFSLAVAITEKWPSCDSTQPYWQVAHIHFSTGTALNITEPLLGSTYSAFQ